MEDRSLLSAGGMGHMVPPNVAVPALFAPAALPQSSTTAAATQLSLYLPSGVQVGKPVTVFVAARTASGRLAWGDSDTLTVSSTDTGATFSNTGATLPGTVTLNHGIALFQVTFATTGEISLTVSDDAASLTATETTAVVDPTVVTGFALRLPRNVPLGTPVTVQVAAVNGLGRPVSTFNGSVTVNADPSADISPSSDITLTNGVGTFQVTFQTAGPETITVTDDGDPSLSGTATTTVVDPTAVARFAVMMPRHVAAGTPVTVYVVALNGLGRPVTDYAGPITVSSSDTGVVPPADVTWTNGLGSFQVTFTQTGKQTLTVTDQNDTSVTKTVTTLVGTTGMDQGPGSGLGWGFGRFGRIG